MKRQQKLQKNANIIVCKLQLISIDVMMMVVVLAVTVAVMMKMVMMLDGWNKRMGKQIITSIGKYNNKYGVIILYVL